MAFVDAMDTSATATKVVGENGSPEYTAAGVGDARVALFAGLVRGNAAVDGLMDAVVELGRKSEDPRVLADAVALAFNARDARGGKGEKDLFYKLFFKILALAPETACGALLKLVPEYGYWKDLLALYEKTESTATWSAARAHSARLRSALIEMIASQLRADKAALDAVAGDGKAKAKLSLAAKFAPREGKHFEAAFKALVRAMYGDAPDGRKQYRHLLSELNRALDVPEITMCGKRWRDIEIANVSSLCLARSRQAFLNELVKRRRPLSGALAETGDRHPNDPDRVECRHHVREAVKSKKGVKGKQLFPHELVRAVSNRCRRSTLEDDVVDAQWRAIVNDVRAACAKAAEASGDVPGATTASNKVDLGKTVALVDVSGSMSGQPMEVAVALGLIVAEIAAPEFRDRVLTFETNPRWHRIEPSHNLPEKVRELMAAPWGGSTNFAAAMQLILDVCVEHKLEPEDIPQLLVLSDMQFDYANSGASWETHHERLVRLYAEAGLKAVGRPWTPPQITFWNLRGDTRGGYMATSNQEGVRMLSGFSPSLLKLLLSGSPLEQETEIVEVQPDGSTRVTKTGGPTPYTTMRKALDDPRYDPVRLALAASTEAPFARYDFVPSAVKTDSDEDAVLVSVDDDSTIPTTA